MMELEVVRLRVADEAVSPLNLWSGGKGHKRQQLLYSLTSKVYQLE